jgi:hypothetical protein
MDFPMHSSRTALPEIDYAPKCLKRNVDAIPPSTDSSETTDDDIKPAMVGDDPSQTAAPPSSIVRTSTLRAMAYS